MSMPTNPERPRRRSRHPAGGKSRTQQSHVAEADIHAIMRRYRTTGVLPAHRMALARYGDFTVAQDYLDAVEKVRATEDLFDSLPSGTRAALENDPFNLLRVMTDPELRDQALALDLVEPETPEEAEAALAARRGQRPEEPAGDEKSPESDAGDGQEPKDGD